MFITGIGTATPERRFSQTECWDAFQQAPEFQTLNGSSQALLMKVLTGENGISTRHLALENLSDAFLTHPDALHARFSLHAPLLATQAAKRALQAAQIQPHEIDALLISTCTGYLCPGLTSYVSEQLGLRADVHSLDLVGQGCGAALPNLRTAHSLLAAGSAKHVLSICVEICSAAFYLDNDPGVLISDCLFGDGAGAVVCSAQPNSTGRRIEWKMASTLLSPEDRDYLRFEQKNGMLRNILDRKVPTLAGKYAEKLFGEMLAQASLKKEEISQWILHAGGREILSSLQNRLQLTPDDVQHSTSILKEYGNVSSPCVLFVLEKTLQENAPGGWWWMSSFGAGFSCHGAFLKVES
ncbi:MAG: 3-oxoacyl-[acyl-carrier-protein] synthase III C-terminal domain-containing protein [Verrucomicrobiota bacterium]